MDRFTGIGVFVAAVDEGSFAAAAQRFSLSPAMAGKYVSALEAELGAPLLVDSSRERLPAAADQLRVQAPAGQ